MLAVNVDLIRWQVCSRYPGTRVDPTTGGKFQVLLRGQLPLGSEKESEAEAWYHALKSLGIQCEGCGE